ncbi:sodium/solute symporter [Vibrio sp. JC009]|uniref:sodium:solute symporter family transporter n=1 Tax=Vibrio sp. JC009 TaxID=2912314 RepID=UPI0023AE7897|nr:sodium/solute symporter [Vibrio sp. JC009]WED21139.1 sodium/solute symporter [Vibrio sp. JC009]
MVTYSSFAIMGFYAAATLLISYIVNRKSAARGDFSTGGKQFGWFTAGVSILATYISTMTFLGQPGWVYNTGMQAFAIHLNYPIVIFFAVVFFIPVFYKLGLTSIYEYLEHRFGIVARTINSLVFILVQCISAGVILYAVSLILVQILPVSIQEAIIYITLFTALYTYSGGISTVIWTDMLQSVVLFTGCASIFAILLFNLQDGAGASQLAELTEKATIVNLDFDLGVDTTLWAGVVAVAFLHLSVYGSNQLIIQRTLATKNVETAQKSMLVCGFGAFFIYLFFSVIGVLLYLFYQGQSFENSNNIILDFVFNHTNPVVVGLIMSALAAAAMSTLDSTYNSIATVATFDIYKRFINKDRADHHYEGIARKLSLVTAAIVVIPALFAISNESVLKTIASLTSVFVGIRLGSFVLGLAFDKANEKGVIVGSILSIIAIAICRNMDVSWPWFAPVGTAVFLISGLFTSYFWGSNTEDQLSFIQKQKLLYRKPTTSQLSLLLFAAITVGLCFYIPDWLLAALS